VRRAGGVAAGPLGAQVVLRVALSALALAGAQPHASHSYANLERAVREPVRWTAGASNELMGVLTPAYQKKWIGKR